MHTGMVCIELLRAKPFHSIRLSILCSCIVREGFCLCTIHLPSAVVEEYAHYVMYSVSYSTACWTCQLSYVDGYCNPWIGSVNRLFHGKDGYDLGEIRWKGSVIPTVSPSKIRSKVLPFRKIPVHTLLLRHRDKIIRNSSDGNKFFLLLTWTGVWILPLDCS